MVLDPARNEIPVSRLAAEEDVAMRPIGLAFAALVAGLSAGMAGEAVADAEASPVVRGLPDGPAPEAWPDEDPTLLLGPGRPVAPFEDDAPPQPDLFDL